MDPENAESLCHAPGCQGSGGLSKKRVLDRVGDKQVAKMEGETGGSLTWGRGD